METVRCIRTFLWGGFDSRPLSRMDFLPQALKILFIRQPVTMIIAYLAIYIVESYTIPELLQLILIIVGAIAATCFLVPYYVLMYRRLQGSMFPFPRAIVCAIITAYLFFPSPDSLSWSGVVISVILNGFIYGVLFLLPNKKNASAINK